MVVGAIVGGAVVSSAAADLVQDGQRWCGIGALVEGRR